MSDQYVGEIRIFPGNYAPQGWAICNGSLLAIADYTDLFNQIGTTYGGDGVTSFAVPNLTGRMPMHQGNGTTFAQTGGAETVALSTAQMPTHTHAPRAASGPGSSAAPQGGVWSASASGSDTLYSTLAPDVALAGTAIGSFGAGLAHDNMPPYLALNFIIALTGVIPVQ